MVMRLRSLRGEAPGRFHTSPYRRSCVYASSAAATVRTSSGDSFLPWMFGGVICIVPPCDCSGWPASLPFAGINAAVINHMNVNVPAIFLTMFSPSISQSLIRSSASGFRFLVRTANLWTQQRLDGAALVHGAVAFGHLLERQLEIEDFAGIDGPALHQLNQLGKVAAHGRRTAVQVHVRVEELRAGELHTVRNPDVADGSARSRAVVGLCHGLLRTDTLEHGVRADAFRQLFDARDAFVSALAHNVSCAKRARERLPCLVTAHCDDPLGAQLLRGQHAEQPDRAIAHHDARRTRLHVRPIGAEPPRTSKLAHRQTTRYLN